MSCINIKGQSVYTAGDLDHHDLMSFPLTSTRLSAEANSLDIMTRDGDRGMD